MERRTATRTGSTDPARPTPHGTHPKLLRLSRGFIELDRIDSRRTNHEPLEDEGRLLPSHASLRFRAMVPSGGPADRVQANPKTAGNDGARSAARRSKRGEGT